MYLLFLLLEYFHNSKLFDHIYFSLNCRQFTIHNADFINYAPHFNNAAWLYRASHTDLPFYSCDYCFCSYLKQYLKTVLKRASQDRSYCYVLIMGDREVQFLTVEHIERQHNQKSPKSFYKKSVLSLNTAPRNMFQLSF